MRRMEMEEYRDGPRPADLVQAVTNSWTLTETIGAQWRALEEVVPCFASD